MLLEANNISKAYKLPRNTLEVLKGVSLKVNEGEILAVVGPSGAGKSTLLHILGGLDNPSQGEVLLDDVDLYSLNDVARAKVRNQKLGFVFQFYHLLPEFDALENVLLPLMIKENSGNTKHVESVALSLLDRVGLKERATHKPSELSGGEQQRVAIARALVNQPKLILCDEPTGNLDSASGQHIIDLLFELSSKNNQTLVIVTHDENIAKLSHRTIHLRDGQLQSM